MKAAQTGSRSMSAAAIYLGDEPTAAGYCLAGVTTIVPASGAEEATLREALAVAPLVLISAAVAERIPETALQAVQAQLRPLAVVVPDILGDAVVPDVAGRMRSQLGLEA